MLPDLFFKNRNHDKKNKRRKNKNTKKIQKKNSIHFNINMGPIYMYINTDIFKNTSHDEACPVSSASIISMDEARRARSWMRLLVLLSSPNAAMPLLHITTMIATFETNDISEEVRAIIMVHATSVERLPDTHDSCSRKGSHDGSQSPFLL